MRMVVWVQNGCKCISSPPFWSRGWLGAPSAQNHKRVLFCMSLAWDRMKFKIRSMVLTECMLLSHHCKVEKSLRWGPSVLYLRIMHWFSDVRLVCVCVCVCARARVHMRVLALDFDTYFVFMKRIWTLFFFCALEQFTVDWNYPLLNFLIEFSFAALYSCVLWQLPLYLLWLFLAFLPLLGSILVINVFLKTYPDFLI